MSPECSRAGAGGGFGFGSPARRRANRGSWLDRCCNHVVQAPIGMVIRQRLILEHIACPGDPALLERRNQGGVIDDRAA